MRLLSFLFLCCSLCFSHKVTAQKSANEILKEACQQAAKEKKNVFVIFHASWCGWCHKMDSAMNDNACKPLFNNNYVIRHLVVLESDNKKNFETPGALDLLKKYNGDNQGIPYWLILDKNGNLLADAQIRPEGAGLEEAGKNTGCPATPEEIAHFLKVLKKTSVLNTDQLAVIKKRFSKN